MNKIRTQSLILKNTNYGESDRILSFITPTEGKIRGIAKGARKSLKRFGGCLEPFTLIEIIVSKGKGLYFISEAKLVRDFRKIKGHIEKMSHGSYMLELTDVMLAEGDSDNSRKIFSNLLQGLEDLETSDLPEEPVRTYEIGLLSLMGYLPHFISCISCGKSLPEIRGSESVASLPFDVSRGGMVCPLCSRRCEGKKEMVSIGTLKTLNAAASGRVSYTKHSMEESSRIIPPFIEMHLGKKLKSLAFIESIKGV